MVLEKGKLDVIYCKMITFQGCRFPLIFLILNGTGKIEVRNIGILVL